MRDTIFICHATPDDNDFVRWLGARLIGRGYRVWADLLGLKGGSPFWLTIEDVIRHAAIKVLFVATHRSVNPAREGVRNELSVAAAVRRSLQDSGFIIPLRLDDVPFEDLPIQVHQLNAIDFHAGWGAKLLELLDTLETANVPRSGEDSSAFNAWRAEAIQTAAVVEAVPEELVTDLLPLIAMPNIISFLTTPGEAPQVATNLKERGVPASAFHQLIITFASQEEAQDALGASGQVDARAVISTADFMSGGHPAVTVPRRAEAAKIATALLRLGVEHHLTQRGLLRHATSAGDAFYFPSGLLDDDRVRYRLPNGRQTYKQIIGRSERHRVNWHLALRTQVKLAPTPFVRFVPYIVFTEAGRPIDDALKSARLRKAFCRNWWNPQWRQLQHAFHVFLAGEGEHGRIEVPLGHSQRLVLASKPLVVISQRRIAGDSVEVEECEPPEPIDEEDDVFDEICVGPEGET